MNLDFINEPELEFGGAGRHVDIRFGLMSFGPLDQTLATAPKQIRVGIVGTNEAIEKLTKWIDQCRTGVGAKASKQPNLFPPFPGFGEGMTLPADILTDPSIQRALNEHDVEKLCAAETKHDVVSDSVTLLLDELGALAEKGSADVLLCAVPFSLQTRMAQPTAETEDEEAPPDLHDMLKARAMPLGVPLQLILPSTYDETKRLRQVSRDQVRRTQDAATRAWNLYAAMYYKAGGTPWRLLRDPAQLTVCYIGVSFFESLDDSALHTSTAQIFNERGEGIVLRGGAATISKEDRQPHLDAAGAKDLLARALKVYRGEHKTLPARVLLCKTSSFNAAEMEGFSGALDDARIESADLVNVGDSSTRLFRNGSYPPLRGTLLSKDATKHVLYTRGSVDFFETYPGMYIPRPLALTCADVQQTPRFIAQELLALTKMNWNNTQFDNSEPIVVTAARKVGHILRYVTTEKPQTRYGFYM